MEGGALSYRLPPDLRFCVSSAVLIPGFLRAPRRILLRRGRAPAAHRPGRVGYLGSLPNSGLRGLGASASLR
jgi:hypothetical protein